MFNDRNLFARSMINFAASRLGLAHGTSDAVTCALHMYEQASVKIPVQMFEKSSLIVDFSRSSSLSVLSHGDRNMPETGSENTFEPRCDLDHNTCPATFCVWSVRRR